MRRWIAVDASGHRTGWLTGDRGCAVPPKAQPIAPLIDYLRPTRFIENGGAGGQWQFSRSAMPRKFFLEPSRTSPQTSA